MTFRMTLSVLAFCVANALPAQLTLETILLEKGGTVRGEVLSIGTDRLVLGRRIGRGSVKETIPFSRIAPNSLYALLVSAWSPLDRVEHRRIADIAFDRGLFAVARRHYLATAGPGGRLDGEVEEKLAQCVQRDLEKLLRESRRAMDAERFNQARSRALLVLRRYPKEPGAKAVPALLDEITKAYEKARRRAATARRVKRERAAWRRGEALLADVRRWLDKALLAESKGLQATARPRSATTYLNGAIKSLRRGEKKAISLHQSSRLPKEMKPDLARLEEQIIDLQVRVRLHLASLYTVRGSYGTALAYVNGALAYDPANEQALAARARIEEAAAVSSARWGGRFFR